MKSTTLSLPRPEDPSDVALRVADLLAESFARGQRNALLTARALSEEELRLGLDFVSTVLEVASGSARVIAMVLAERIEPPARPSFH
ncbi:MAG: hypothetical protein SGJ01_17465 [Gemmatimonadota bacterium]|nr:hypothetical protein [Gemmatimonadota bacterium]